MRIFKLAVIAELLFAAIGQADEIDPARRTATVDLIARCLPTVVCVRAERPGEKPNELVIEQGSGSVFHPDGHILTNAHVIKNSVRGNVEFSDRRSLPYRIIARFTHEDLAIIKVESDRPFVTLPLGRSNDLLLGEPVVVIGNAAALGHSASTGIVSGLGRASNTQDAFLPWLVQTTAAVNGGNSGGPLINAVGEQIGIVTSRKDDAENINFAIAIDRVRTLFPRIIAAEERFGFWLGCDVATLEPQATVLAVTDSSPAAVAGMKPGDVVRKVGDAAVRHGLDFQLALIDHKPGDALAVSVERDGKPMDLTVMLTTLPLAEPVAETNATGGLHLAFYSGAFDKLPDFAQLKPAVEHAIDKPTLGTITGGRDNFALQLTGFLKVPADGLYTLFCHSDDGSRVSLDGKVVIDHDGLHAPSEAAGLVRLKAGLHPIVVEYFERVGSESLRLSWEGPELAKQEIPTGAYFQTAEAKK